MILRNIYSQLKESHWEFQGEGLSTAKIFRGKYEAKLEIPGEYLNVKSYLGGSMDIFWNCTLELNPREYIF